MSEKAKFTLRIPEHLHKWLKENVKDKSINDFILDLLKDHIEKPQEGKTEYRQRDWVVTDAVKSLLEKRMRILRDSNVEQTKAFFMLENHYFGDHGAHADKEEVFGGGPGLNKPLNEVINAIEENAMKEYFEPARKLAQDQQWALYQEGIMGGIYVE